MILVESAIIMADLHTVITRRCIILVRFATETPLFFLRHVSDYTKILAIRASVDLDHNSLNNHTT